MLSIVRHVIILTRFTSLKGQRPTKYKNDSQEQRSKEENVAGTAWKTWRFFLESVQVSRH